MSRAQDRLTARVAERGALALGALAGMSAWMSLGTLAITSDRLTRVGVLSPFWALAALAAVGLLLAAAIRLRTADAWPLLLTLILWLPWLPLPIASAMTIWEGPMEAIVWLASVGGVLVARLWPSRERLIWATNPRHAQLAITALMAAASLTAAVALSTRIPGGDEPHYLIITQSLLKDGDLRIENNHDRGDYFEYFDAGLPPDFLQRGRDGQIYSIHAPGVAVLILPAFLIAGYPGAVVLMALVVSAGIARSWRTALDVGVETGAAWAGAVAVGASATVFLHSFSIFPDPAGLAVVAIALALLVRLAIAPEAVRPWQVAATGAVLGFLPWLHTRFAIVAGALGVVFAARLWTRADRWRLLGAFSAAPALLALAWFAYFWVIYGTPNPAAPYGTGQQSSLFWAPRGAVGLAFDQQFGLFANAPVLALLPFGWLQLYRQSRRLALELLIVAVPYVLVVASFGMWWGGWSAPARFLDCIMPLAVPLMALAWRDANRGVRCVFVALVFVGVINVVLRIAVLNGLLLHNYRDGYDLLLDWLSRAVNLPLAFPGVHRSGATLAAVIASIWLASGLVTITVVSAVLAKPRSRGAQWALTAGVGVALSSAAMSASWTVSHAIERTPEASQMDLLQRWRPDFRPLAVEMPGWRRIQTASVLNKLEISSSRRPREASSDPALLTVAWLPAGDYQLVIEGDRELDGVLTASVGMTSLPIEKWNLNGLPSGATSLRVSLPALAHSLTVRGDEVAARRITRVWLRPQAIRDHLDRGGEYVIRAAHYHHARVFLLDDEIYLESGGLWTRGNSSARLVLTSDRTTVPVDLQAGPVATSVSLVAGEWTAEAKLGPGERRRLDVPASGLLIVRTAAGFRPADYDPKTRDVRGLGVRLEFPGQ